MNWDELKFEVDDFHQDAVLEGPGGPYISLAQANRILREKLDKSKEVWLCMGELQTAHLAQPVDATHSARLVCIEGIGK